MRVRLDRVLCALDFSSAMEPTLEIASALSARLGARLDLVHVLEAPPATLRFFGEGSLATRQREAAAEKLEQARKRAAERGIEADSHLVEGSPAEQITAHADRLGAGLIVIGTRGNSGPPDGRIGSVADFTVRQARCPVLVVPPCARPD
jgi:nucleotide-binding universal stress UspA family protein